MLISIRHWPALALAIAVTAVAAGARLRAPQDRSPGVQPAAAVAAGVRLDDHGSPAALGLAGDAILNENGPAFVLDVLGRRVLAFRRDGTFQSSFGTPGRGPGELVAPAALAAGRDGSIFVLDPGNQRIEVYGGPADQPVRLRSLPLDFVAEDLCAIGESLYVLGARNGYVIHQLSPADGTVLKSFVPHVDAADPFMGSQAASGYVACDASGRITFLPMLQGEIRQFSSDTGALLGTLAIPNYVAAVVKKLSDGAMLFQEPEGGRSEAASSILSLADGRQIVQVGLPRPGSATRHEFESLRSLVVSWRDGTITPIRQDIPRLLATDGRSMLSAQTDPEPAVHMISLDLQRGEDR